MARAFLPKPFLLLAGDVFFFTFGLWVTLFLRTFDLPTLDIFLAHLGPFSILFIAWVAVFFVAGLYETRTILFARRAISVSLLVSQTLNVAVAALFFFFIPIFGIAPKTILAIYLVVSFCMVFAWRVLLFPRFGLKKSERAIIVGNSVEVAELTHALTRAPYAPAYVVASVDPTHPTFAQECARAIAKHRPRFVIADLTNPRVAALMADLYIPHARDVRFFDTSTLYEEIFGRVPLSQVTESWVASNASQYAYSWYDSVKRLMDITAALLVGALSLVLYPVIMLAIMAEDGKAPFVAMPRVGQNGRLFTFYKFRSMSGNDRGNYGAGGTTKLYITKVGRFLRAKRLDELPQLWNVLRGDLSLIGPRPELPALVAQYEAVIPYYGVRHLVKPGLSGWAQLYHHADPHHATDVEATKMKLSYDLYYLKHRSLTLDIVIAIKTIRRLIIKSNA